MGKIFLKEAIGCQMKKPSARSGKPPLRNLVKNGRETTTTRQTIAIVLGCPPKFHGKCLVLKIPHISHSTWINKADTDKVASSLLAAFIILEGAR